MSAVKVLVLGGGGREHALVWRLLRDPDVSQVIAAPGNPGMAALARCVPADLLDPAELLGLVEREAVDLTVVGPEAPLERGLADLFRTVGRPIVGPTRIGAALECSKAYSKHFMARHRIPTARYAVCDTIEAALSAVAGDEFGWPVVVKADGLAAGKGVVVAETRDEAERAVRASMEDGQFGAAGSRLVIEECLVGPEVSFFVLCDGHRALSLGTAQDHKRIWDDDRGPNTGGMGAFAPSPLMPAALEGEVMHLVVEPLLAGMRAEGEPYSGFLYVSLMLTAHGPKVIEFNVRLGDPEAQVVLPWLEGRLGQALMAAALGNLGDARLSHTADCFVGVVVASHGYPGSADTGRAIRGLDRAADVPGALVFHAGTRSESGQIVTAGGRVLTVVGRGRDYRSAMDAAYHAVSFIEFEGMQFRRDIGRKAIAATGNRP
jgi:phosphoribosylamine--glycine ligase